MDGLDIRLLRALGARPFSQAAVPLPERTPSRLAKRFKVTRNTVTERIAGMQKSGVIARFEAYPNFRQLGLEWCTFHVRAPSDALKQQAMRQLPMVEGLSRLVDFLGSDICFDLYYGSADERERRMRLCSELAGAPAANVLEARKMPAPARPLSSADWKLVKALRGDGRRAVPSLAKALGVSYRTAKRRFDALVAAGNLDIVPIVDPGRIPNAIPFGALFRFEGGANEKAAAAIVRLFDERYFFADIPPDAALGSFALQGYADSAAELERQRAASMAVPGVQQSWFLLVSGVRADEAWLDDAIARRAEGP